MKIIRKTGVVGAGTMGSALAQKFAMEGYSVTLADRDMTIVQKGLNNIMSTLDEGVQRKLFTPEQVNEWRRNLVGTDNLKELRDCDLVVEAIYENFKAKSDLFRELSSFMPPQAIIASNTSSFSITELSASMQHPERFLGLHYFYHAAKNRLVEIVPGEKTSRETLRLAYQFSIMSGKDPIFSIDAYGFVVNRFFVPWLNEAVKLHEEKFPIPVIEEVCKQAFGITMGPFELMNVTGVPVAMHAEKTLEIFGSLYTVAPGLEKQVALKENWNLSGGVSASESDIKTIRERMLGVVFFICSQILQEGICSASEIDRGAKIGLRWKKGPVEMMRELGEKEIQRLVVMLTGRYNMEMPRSIGQKYWKPVNVKLSKNNSVAVIRMDQPENLNALSEETVKQLSECFQNAENDKDVKTIFITGSGKAFVAGADIRFFVNNMKKERICDIETFTEYGQQVFDRIDRSGKKVVAIVNGLVLGGGLELALCADVILAVPKAAMAFPETGIGIYPGLGGTQRTVRRVGKGFSKYLVLTGKMLTAKEAEETGLIDKVISPEEMFAILNAETPVPEHRQRKPGGRWKAIHNFFENNSLGNILAGHVFLNDLPAEESAKITKALRFKAPVALKLADRLIEDAQGCASELTHLREVFSTSDAMKGLTSIGQKVTYEGK